MYHMFNVYVAKIVGVEAAVILENLAFWVRKNAENSVNYYDGYYWTYNSVKAFANLFPYLTDRQIRLAIEKLKKKNYIIVGHYSQNKYDRTNWYTITESGWDVISKSVKTKIDLPKMTNVYTDNKPDNKPDSKPDNIIIYEPLNEKQQQTAHVHQEMKEDYEIPPSQLHTPQEMKEDNETYTPPQLHSEKKRESPPQTPAAPPPKTTRFIKPSVDDIRQYCNERMNSIDPEQFFDYYESKGWMVGRNHMKDWKAAIRLWERNSYQTKQQTKNTLSKAERELLLEKAKYTEYALARDAQLWQ